MLLTAHVSNDDCPVVANAHLRPVAFADSYPLGEAECRGEPVDGLAHVGVHEDGDDGGRWDRPIGLHAYFYDRLYTTVNAPPHDDRGTGSPLCLRSGSGNRVVAVPASAGCPRKPGSAGAAAWPRSPITKRGSEVVPTVG